MILPQVPSPPMVVDSAFAVTPGQPVQSDLSRVQFDRQDTDPPLQPPHVAPPRSSPSHCSAPSRIPFPHTERIAVSKNTSALPFRSSDHWMNMRSSPATLVS